MNIVTVKINGIEYNLKGDENDEYLHKVAGYVDKKIRGLLGSNAKLSTTSAAVLSTVNVVDELFKSDKANAELVVRTEDIEKSETLLLEQVEALKKQIQHLENYNSELQNRIKVNSNEDRLKEKEDLVERLNRELATAQDISKKDVEENISLKTDVKELRFQLQSAKYKIMGLQNKLIENQIDLVKVKRTGNTLLNTDK